MNWRSKGPALALKKLLAISRPTVSREDIVWCYRTFLGREPESEVVIRSHAHNKCLRDLVQVFIRSPEFAAKDRKTVSRHDVVWAYRTLLGREPESDTAIAAQLRAKNLHALIEAIARSAEFGTRKVAPSRAVAARVCPSPPPISPKANEALAMAEYRAGITKVNSTPQLLTLETSSRCNLRCVMCPQAIGAVDRPRHLEEDLVSGLERFIRQSKSIQLHGIGEPLASPAFWESLKFIPADCDASINTNLTVLDERRLANLLASTIKLVNVSLDAACADTYRKIRGFSFDEVVGNIQRLLAGRQASGKKTPLLHMNMTLMRSNIEEVPEFIELATRLGADAVSLWHLNQWPDAEMDRYRVERDGWVFDYRKEGLWNYPALSNEYLRKAVALARERGIRLVLDQNKVVYFDEGAEVG